MTAHSALVGGSSAERRMFCPGSARLEPQYPDRGSSMAADEGSMLHSAVEFWLTYDAEDPVPFGPAEVTRQGAEWSIEAVFNEGREWVRREGPEQLIGWTFAPYTELAVTPEHVETKIEPALAAWQDVLDRYTATAALFEQRLTLPGAGFGTADVLAATADPKTKIVLDWKFGHGVVPAHENYQLAYYALGAMLDPDPDVRDLMDGAERFVFAVVQPSRYPALDVWETTADWVRAFHGALLRAIEKSQEATAPLSPGRWCKWCRAKPGCPALKSAAATYPKVEPEAMSEVELAEALALADPLEQWVKAVRAFAKDQLDAGVVVPGWKRVAQQTRRKWKHEYEAEVVLGEIGIASPYETKLWSPSVAEKKVGREVFAERLAPLVVKPVGGTVLAPDTDKRPPVGVDDDLVGALRRSLEKVDK